MKLIRGLHNLQYPSASGVASKGSVQALLADGCVATIGNFDGVHLGHQAILAQVKVKAAALGVPSVVVVFEPQPREYFGGDQAPPRLMRFREKLVALREQGVDILVCLQFNQRLRSLTAEQFVHQVLMDGLRVRHLVVGDDFRFGCDRAGDFHLLERMGRETGFSVEHTRTFEIDGERVSSTRIRQALAACDFEGVRRMLGRPYYMSGRVIHGAKLGRQLGVPTANIALGRRRLPLTGVFAVEVLMEGEAPLPAVANVGIRPSVNGVKPLLEVHLLDFSRSIYGVRLQVVFRAKLRDEQRFPSLDALKAQIEQDIQAARRVFGS